jgi:D-cysteine desulfhydrase
MLGRALLGLENWRILGVPVSDSVDYFQQSLRELERATVDQFQLNLSPEQTPIELIDGFIGEGYAIAYPAAVETIRLLGRTEGIVLDPSYTSKGVTGWLASVKDQLADRLPVYIHTGGSFGLLARRDLIAART